jgi:hypothetical protein
MDNFRPVRTSLYHELYPGLPAARTPYSFCVTKRQHYSNCLNGLRSLDESYCFFGDLSQRLSTGDHGRTDMRLDDHFGSGSTLQRNERVKLAASFWNNVGAGMVIGGMAGAFFLDKPLTLGQNRYCGRRTCAWLALLFNRQQHSHVPAQTTRGTSLSRVAASDEQTSGREDNPRDECCHTGEQQKVVDDVGHDAPRAAPQTNGLPPTPSACPYRGQNVATPARFDDYCGRRGDGATLMPIKMSCQCPNKNPARGEWVAGFRDGRLCGLGSSEPSVDVNVARRKEKRCVPRYRRWLTREF